jgi:hypothetical protein
MRKRCLSLCGKDVFPYAERVSFLNERRFPENADGRISKLDENEMGFAEETWQSVPLTRHQRPVFCCVQKRA